MTVSEDAHNIMQVLIAYERDPLNGDRFSLDHTSGVYRLSRLGEHVSFIWGPDCWLITDAGGEWPLAYVPITRPAKGNASRS